MSNAYLATLYQEAGGGYTEEDMVKIATIQHIEKLAAEGGEQLSDEEREGIAMMTPEELGQFQQAYALAAAQDEAPAEGEPQIFVDDEGNQYIAASGAEEGEEAGYEGYEGGYEEAGADEVGLGDVVDLGVSSEELGAMGFDKESQADLAMAHLMGQQAGDAFVDEMVKQAATPSIPGLEDLAETRLMEGVKKGPADAGRYPAGTRAVSAVGRGRGAAGRVGDVGKTKWLELAAKHPQLAKWLKRAGLIGAGAGVALTAKKVLGSGYETVVYQRAQQLADMYSLQKEAEVESQMFAIEDVDGEALNVLAEQGFDLTPVFDQD